MIERKTKELDGIDREILRVLFLYRPLVSRKIAQNVGLSASAIAPRLKNLENLGIIKKVKLSGLRKYKVNSKKGSRRIKSYQSIYWDLDLVGGGK